MLIGMAHRGRLNVLAHVLNKPYAQMLAEFKDPVTEGQLQDAMSWTGDVKYHAGAHRAIHTGREMHMVVSMPPNPSHLEAVDPVVMGMARAAGTTRARASRRSTPASAPGAGARRRRLPGSGHRGRNAEHLPAAGLHDGRHDPPHRQQPDRLHHMPLDAYSTSTPATWRRGSRSPWCTSTRTIAEACLEVARLAIAYRDEFQRISSSTSSAIGATGTTKAMSRPSRSRTCTG